MSISPQMQEALRNPRRTLCWLFYVEGQDTDLWAWTGQHEITYGGQAYTPVGQVLDMGTIKKSEVIQHTVQQFTLNGLDPNVLTDLDLSVRGRTVRVWLAALNDDRQIITSPILISELVQDTLAFERSTEDVLKLTLSAFEALPFAGRATGRKYSHETQLQTYGDDYGMHYLSDIAVSGQAVEWRQGTV